MPTWGSPHLAEVNFDDIHYFVRASEKPERSWDDVPADVKKTFDRLGIPEAERKFLAGVGAQYESEVVYHQINEKLEAQGVIFMDMDTGLREHAARVREDFATIIPPNANKPPAPHSARWPGRTVLARPRGAKHQPPQPARQSPVPPLLSSDTLPSEPRVAVTRLGTVWPRTALMLLAFGSDDPRG